jgi:hypothetical protein
VGGGGGGGPLLNTVIERDTHLGGGRLVWRRKSERKGVRKRRGTGKAKETQNFYSFKLEQNAGF